MRGRKKRILMLITLSCLLVFMGVGFAVARTTLNIGGTSTAINTWDVRITDLVAKENETGAKSSNTEINGSLGTTATFSATFHAPGDYIEYDVEVRNKGSLDATLYSIVVTPSGDDIDLFEFSHTAEQGSVLKAGEAITITVKVTYKLESTRLPRGETKFELNVNYGQGENNPGGNTPGGGTDTPKPDNWDFEVDEDGTIVAYNYDLGTDVVVPATNYQGKPITAITSTSFKDGYIPEEYPEVPVNAFVEPDTESMVAVILAEEPYFTIAKDKLLEFLANDAGCNDMESDAEKNQCKQQISNMVSFYKKDQFNNTLYEYQITVFVDSDPTNPWQTSLAYSSNVLEYSYAKVDAFVNPTTGGMLGVIDAHDPYFEFIKIKIIQYLKDDCENNYSGDDSIKACKQSLSEIKFYRDHNYSETGYNHYMSVYTNSDPNVAWYDSFKETLTGTANNNLVKPKSKKLLSAYNNTKNNIVKINAVENPKITSVDLSKATNLKTIGDNSFSNLEITNINFGDNNKITTIGKNAFSGNKIQSLVLPSSVTKVGSNAFASNPLTTLTVEKCSKDVCALTTFGTNLINVTVNSGEITDYAFSNSLVEKLNIGSEVTSIGAYSFTRANLALSSASVIVIFDEINFNKIVNCLNSMGVTGITYMKASQANSEVLTNIITTMYLNLETGSFDEALSSIIELNISEGSKLTTIGDYAFYGGKINNLVFPNSLTTIGEYTFYQNQISSLTIPNSVTTIGTYAFYSNQISSLTIPNSVTTIGDSAFESNQISSLTIPNSVTTIGDSAFRDNQISSLTIPNSVTTIGDSAFESNQISELYYPKTITSLGSKVFNGNPLENLTIEECTAEICYGSSANGNYYFGNKVKRLEIKSGEIGDYAFYSNSNSTTKIENLILGEGVTSIGTGAFQCNAIEKIVLPTTLSTIGDWAFHSNQISGELVIPDSVTTIGISAFYKNQISSLVLGGNLTTIGDRAFYENQISELYYPKTVTSLGGYSFDNNPLENLTIEECTTEICYGSSTNGNYYFGNKVKRLEIKSGEIGDYAFCSNSNSTTKIENLILGEGVTSIGTGAFQYNAIEKIVLPTTLSTIGDYAFKSNQISELYYPKTVTSLGSDVFKNNAFEKVTLEECNTTICSGTSRSGNSYFGNQIKTLEIKSGEIGDYAFYSDSNSTTKIEKLILGDVITSVEKYAFSNNLITEITLPKNLTTIGEDAFSNNLISNIIIPNGITTLNGFKANQISGELIIPDSVTTIGSSAFYYNQISSLVLGGNLTTIGSSAFESNQISELYYPKTVTSLGAYSFYNNPLENLTIEECTTEICYGSSTNGNYYFGNKVKRLEIKSGEIGNYAFTKSQISSLTLRENVTTIGYLAFSSNQITELIIPSTVTTIGSSAFESNQISELYYPKTITSLGRYAFDNNPLENLTIEECNTTICGDSTTGNIYFGDKMKKLKIESGEIGSKAFYRNQAEKRTIEILILGDGVTTIGDYAFKSNQISSLVLGGNLTTIGSSAFESNQISGEIIIPDSVTTIGSYAFYYNQISSLVLGGNLTTIGDYAFRNNQISGELIIPDSVTTIGDRAFESNQISELYYPKTVTSLGASAFKKNQFKNLTIEECNVKICVEGTVVTSSYDENKYFGSSEDLTIKSGVIGAKGFSNQQIITLTLEEGVTAIGKNAFYNNSITNIMIPSTITTIGASAFDVQIDANDNRTLSSILIKRTEEDFLANVTVGTNWYDTTLNPTITYAPS